MTIYDFVSDLLSKKYKGLPAEERRRVQKGMQWVCDQLEKTSVGLEAVTYCKDCEWCFTPKNPDMWDGGTLYCNLHSCSTTENNHCGFND